ncbi:hypothetical protein WN943_006653 [Citrus x changshan-huyou]|uniref:uncharacterized protein LOC102627439 n=1 Tax=Citrus sinensis TaxID=2711 RepID=UPI002279421D|nr:uncharacterized protein LOC102627439 [Citrus sinensis]
MNLHPLYYIHLLPMGFSNTMLSTFKKLGCINQPRVEETSTLPTDQSEEMKAVDGADHEIKETEEEKEDNSKQQTTEVLSEPKGEEDPKTEAFADPSEPKDEEQTNDQEHKTETAAEEDSKE